MRAITVCMVMFLINGTAAAQQYEGGRIHVMSPWSRALPPVSANGAAYVTLKNVADSLDRLVGASSPMADRIEFHDHVMEGGQGTMRRLESVALEPGEYVKFEPGGKHLMLIGLTKPLKAGEQFPLTLVFEHAAPVEVAVMIQPPGAMEPASTGHGHGEKHGHNPN